MYGNERITYAPTRNMSGLPMNQNGACNVSLKNFSRPTTRMMGGITNGTSAMNPTTGRSRGTFRCTQ